MRSTWILAAGVLSFVITQQAFAQTTSSGLFGSRTSGGSTATSSGGASGGTSGGTAGAASGGTQAAPNVASGAQNVASAAVQTVQTKGAFVGADSQDTTNARSLQAAAGQSGGTNANGMNQLQNMFSQSLQQLNQQSQKASRPKIRVPLKMGFPPQPASANYVQHFANHLTKLPGIRFVGPAEVTMEGRLAVLRGTVATEDDRRLAEALAMMEPEVLAVRNELKVDSTATTVEQLPPGNSP